MKSHRNLYFSAGEKYSDELLDAYELLRNSKKGKMSIFVS